MIKPTILVTILAAALQAQNPFSEFHARVTGVGGPGGKCTGEVVVDEVVEIQIMGDNARMQTIGGQPATWRRLECTLPMPPVPTGFRFRGIDGRGRQTLAHSPEGTGGPAVVRIEDPQRGAEGYTFEIEWAGAAGVNPAVGAFGPYGSANVQAAYAAPPPGVADFAFAVHSCQGEINARAIQAGYSSLVIWAANLQDNAGNNDVLTGNATAVPIRGGAAVRIQYQCTVDASTGRVVDLQIR